jgi:hypothetical protein
MGPAPRERDDDDDDDAGDLVDTTMRPTPGRAAGMGVGSPGTSPNKRAVRKTGSGMRGAAVTHERIASPNGSGNGITRGSTSTIRPVSRLSTFSTSRARVGSTTETTHVTSRPNGTGRVRPTNLSMSINTDRQQAKFAGRLRFPHGHGHGNGSEGRESPISPTTPSSMTSGSARPSTKIVAKTTATATAKTTMTMTNGTKAPSARPGGQAGVGGKERLEKGKALVLPKAPGGRI